MDIKIPDLPKKKQELFHNPPIRWNQRNGTWRQAGKQRFIFLPYRCILPVTESHNQSLSDHMEQITRQIDQVKAELEEAPDNPALLNELGVGYHLVGEYEEAVETFEKALEKDSGDHRIHFNLANSLVELQQIDRAVNHYLDALDRQADFIPALNNLADIYQMAGEQERALELFQYITNLAPDDPVGHFNLGNHHLRMNNTLEAGRAYQQTLELDPDHYEAYNNIGFILKHLGKYEEAIGYYAQCLEIQPDYQPALDDIRECRRKVEEEKKGEARE